MTVSLEQHHGLENTGNQIICQRFVEVNNKRKLIIGFCGGIHRWQMDSPHWGSILKKMFPCDIIMLLDISKGRLHVKIVQFRELIS